MPAIARCPWAGADPRYVAYHDEEWGVPSADDRHLFEMLCLEGAQAGLSWLTILRKREGYRRAFDGFDPAKVARYDARRIGRLLADPGIVRNRMKVEAAVRNAKAVLALGPRHGSLAALLWGLAGGAPRQNRWRAPGEIPASTTESEAMSRALRGLGFGFVGPTVCYAFMQAVGMVNDHTVDCFRHREVRSLGERFVVPGPGRPTAR
jgi:DNA-3-methyladenine glycosylase I